MNERGVTDYQGGQAGTSARRVFDRIRKKVSLRSELEALQSQIDRDIQKLSQRDLQELSALIQGEVCAADNDVAALRAQVEAERKLAQTTKSQVVRIPRRAVAALAAEAERRIERGCYPSAEALTGEAIVRAYGGRS